MTDAEKSDVDLFTAKYESEMDPKFAAQTLKSELQNLKQRQDERAEDFAFKITELADKAYGNREIKNECALSALISGIKDRATKEKILEDEITNFDDAVKLACKREKIASAVNPERSDEQESLPVFRVQTDQYRQNSRNTPEENDHVTRMSYRQRRQPLYCWSCSEPGHYAAACPHKRFGQDRSNEYGGPRHTENRNYRSGNTSRRSYSDRDNLNEYQVGRHRGQLSRRQM